MSTPKDFRQAWTLLLLRSGSSYGYELRRELRQRELKVDPAVMYRTLREMEHAGWISSSWSASEAGPRRHCYDITAAGRAELARIAAEITAACEAQRAFLAAYKEPGEVEA